MKKVFAILYEPASYTVDRNIAVYDKMGVDYCYMHDTSLAKADNLSTIDTLPSSFFRRCQRLNQILHDYDIVIINGCTDIISISLFIINLFYRRPIGIELDCQLVLPQNKIKRYIKSLIMPFFFRNKKHYGLPGGTKKHTDYFLYYGMAKNRIFLMPMVVNNDKFGYNGPRDNRVFKFLYVGRVEPEKNIELLLNAFVLSFGNERSKELHIVGKGSLLDNYHEQYKNSRNIIFEGAKYGEDLISAYRTASCFVLPSSYEPWGLVVNEAMASGLPCIVSDKVGAGGDLIENRSSGFIFKNNDIEELKKCLIKISSDDNLYSKTSQNAYETAHGYWNYELCKKSLETFINSAK